MKEILLRSAKLLINIFGKLNAICKSYEHLLQTLGIVVGLYLIYLTYFSVKISNEQLKISQKQEYQKQLPIWEFDIDDNTKTAKLRPFSTDIKLEQATAYFSDKLFYRKSCNWEIDQPDFLFHLTLFNLYVEQLILANTSYDTSYVSIALRNNFPVGLELTYVQFGELRTVYAIFSIQYTWVRSNESNVKLTLNGIKFTKYIMGNENLEDELNKIVEVAFKGIKRPNDY